MIIRAIGRASWKRAYSAVAKPPCLVSSVSRRPSIGESLQPHPILLLGGPFQLPFNALQDYFASKGYESTAVFPSLESLPPANLDYVYDLAEITRTQIKTAFPPIIVSTGFGCHVASKYLESHPATAVVFCCPSSQFTSFPKALAELRKRYPVEFAKAERTNNLLDLMPLVHPSPSSIGPANGIIPLKDFVDPPSFIRDPASIFKIESALASRLQMLVLEFETNADPEARNASDEIAARLECDYTEVQNGDGKLGWEDDKDVAKGVGEAICSWLDGIGL
jgi:hypothetical protein